MGSRGPRPLPTALKLMRGTLRQTKAARREPQPDRLPDCPPPPRYLNRVAREEWRRVAPVLHQWGGLRDGDQTKLATYCQAVARWREAERVIDEQGMTFRTESGYVVQRPEVSISRAQATLVRQLGSDFGLDPSSRSRITAPEPPEEQTDPAETFLFGTARRVPSGHQGEGSR
jgi:P27 family predicted phage terminase small subunit